MLVGVIAPGRRDVEMKRDEKALRRRRTFATASVISAARNSRAYGSRNVARSKGTVSRKRSVGGRTRSTSARCSCVRDAIGRNKRDPAVRREFQRQQPCPVTGKTTGACPGYAADHVVALKTRPARLAGEH